MPYSHFTKDERIALQAMAGMRLATCCIAVIVGKHLSGVYRELFRKSERGLYAGTEARRRAGQRRLESRARPKTGDAPLMAAVKDWFKKDRSPDQMAGRLPVEHPRQAEMRRIRSVRCPLRRFTGICTGK